jgi:DNA-binding MarR family transcriptional regulator
MNNIGYLLMKVSKELKYALSKELVCYELTTSQWAVLKQLEIEEAYHSSFSKRTAVEIAAKLDLDKPTISGIINRLYEKEMITKTRHPDDKRATILYLTPKAKELIPALELVSNKVIDESLINFSSEEKEVFLNLLEKIDCSLSRRRE